jgi:predicted transcriptional regulator
MDLPFHLRALPPEALDVLRYFGKSQEQVAHAEVISDQVGLSERTFGKAIRRLVTKGYVQMDGDQAYRLTDDGQEAVNELVAFDSQEVGERVGAQAVIRHKVGRHLSLVAPKHLKAGIPAEIYLAFNPAAGDQQLNGSAEVVIRVSLVNAQPNREINFQLDNNSTYGSFQITPGFHKQIRIRAQAFQLGPNPDDIEVAGGMFVDLDISLADPMQDNLVAFGANVNLILAD